MQKTVWIFQSPFLRMSNYNKETLSHYSQCECVKIVIMNLVISGVEIIEIFLVSVLTTYFHDGKSCIKTRNKSLYVNNDQIPLVKSAGGLSFVPPKVVWEKVISRRSKELKSNPRSCPLVCAPCWKVGWRHHISSSGCAPDCLLPILSYSTSSKKPTLPYTRRLRVNSYTRVL